MGILDSKKDKQSEDTLKILATNIEVINQRLAQTNPEYGFSEMTAGLMKSVDSVSEQIKFISNQIKTSDMGLRQLVNYGVTQGQQTKQELLKSLTEATERMGGMIQQNNQVVGKMMSDLQEFRKATEAEIVALNDNVLRNLQATGTTSSSVSSEMGRLKTEMYSLLKDFNQNVSQTIKTDGKKAHPEVAKEVENLKDNVHSLITNFSKDLSKGDSSASKASTGKIGKDIEKLRDEIHKKFDIMTDVLRDLVQTNMEYVNYLKDPEDSPLEKIPKKDE